MKSISFINRQSLEDNEAQELISNARGARLLDEDTAGQSLDEQNYSEVDLNASYSDDDYENIPIDEKKFWEYLTKLEENSLFEMNLL